MKLTASGRDAAALADQILAEPPAALLTLPPGDLALLEDVLTRLAAATANAPALNGDWWPDWIRASVLADKPRS